MTLGSAWFGSEARERGTQRRDLEHTDAPSRMARSPHGTFECAR